MTLTEALAVKARGLTKEQIIAHLRAVAENNLRADIRTIERAWKEKPSDHRGAARSDIRLDRRSHGVAVHTLGQSSPTGNRGDA